MEMFTDVSRIARFTREVWRRRRIHIINSNYGTSSRRKTSCYNNWKTNTLPISPSNENVEKTLFPVDFDFDSSLVIEVTLTKMHQFVVPGEKYPRISENMTEADFQKWKNSYLQEYLADRSINKTGNKDVLVKSAYGAYCLNLPVTATDL